MVSEVKIYGKVISLRRINHAGPNGNYMTVVVMQVRINGGVTSYCMCDKDGR